MQRPRRVTEALIRAIYATRLQTFEADSRPADALKLFSTEIFPRYRDLYKSSSGLSGDEVDASFLLVALADEPARSERANAVVGEDRPVHAAFRGGERSLCVARTEPVDGGRARSVSDPTGGRL